MNGMLTAREVRKLSIEGVVVTSGEFMCPHCIAGALGIKVCNELMTLANELVDEGRLRALVVHYSEAPERVFFCAPWLLDDVIAGLDDA
jgi:hypothetical protein